ncbi:hypothetical protein M9H77_23559 [Catharanthus roseus]|uniref:Uncharacterized protein n=1 Tax=Catharanthus roseus TaxID=4058 RepID=A0ACC0AUE4_CATRO|nr:hypothetical protein M9H77_23559 [Catharanthus roseus]
MSSAASPPHFFFFVPVPHFLCVPLELCSPLILSLDGSDGLRHSFPTKIERVVSHRDVDSFSAPMRWGILNPLFILSFGPFIFLNRNPARLASFQLPAGSTSVYDHAQILSRRLMYQTLSFVAYIPIRVATNSVSEKVQVATGFAMTFYYRPTVTEAFASVQYKMTEANFGWLIRSVHRWSASMMVLMMILHVFRVYLTGGFKKPRELTWVIGVVLAVLTASYGVTCYSLPWDQIGYWAVKIIVDVPEAIPVIGSPLVELLRGSASVEQSTLTCFYSLHTRQKEIGIPVSALGLTGSKGLDVHKDPKKGSKASSKSGSGRLVAIGEFKTARYRSKR